MKRKFCITIALLMLVLTTSLYCLPASAANTEEWIPRADLPEPRMGAAAVTLNGKIYVFGGASNSNQAATGIKHNTTYEYDPLANSWTKKADMPTARAGLSAVVYENKAYVIGGYLDIGGTLQRSNRVEVYDPTTDTWTKVADMPTARSWASAVTINNKIYVFGGGKNANESGTKSTALATVECYDPVTNKWTTKKDMPFLGNGTVAAVVNEKVYLFGGMDYTSTVGTIYEYDPNQDSWSLKNNSTSRNGNGITVVNGKIYLLGGASDGLKNLYDTADIYDPSTNTTSSMLSLTFPRAQNISVAIGNKLYVIGGTNDTGNEALKTVEMYTISNPDPTDPNPEPEQPTGNRAILVVTMTTGLEKEFDLSMQEVKDFINWYENKQAGNGTASYAIDKHNNNKGPFTSRKNYVIYNMILTYEVNEYSSSKK
ncbi:Kelch repeat-containing protein [Paenibacillus azoreducens]|uniref:Kelch repeat-containing protein n=1 Tax=Paenibacillus azoreducens TaxID=116718 RepID=UPI0039F45636